MTYYLRLTPQQKRAQEELWQPPHKKHRTNGSTPPGPETNGTPRTPNGGNPKGNEAEGRFLRICQEAQARGQFPEWLTKVTIGSHADDCNGIDFVAHTTVGAIPLQVKSSQAGKVEFHRKAERRHIICIIVSHRFADEEVLSTLIGEVSFIWEAMEKARAAR